MATCITNIRLWNRTDTSDDVSLPVDYYNRRLFPCVIMISQQPFRTDLRGKEALDASMSQSVAHIRFTEDTQMSNWDVPKFTEIDVMSVYNWRVRHFFILLKLKCLAMMTYFNIYLHQFLFRWQIRNSSSY